MARGEAGPGREQLSDAMFVMLTYWLMNSSEGMPGWARPGEATAFDLVVGIAPSSMERWFRARTGDAKSPRRSHFNYESRPCVLRSLPPFRGSEKSVPGCLTYSRIWCLSRNKHHIWWPNSVKGIERCKCCKIQVSRFKFSRFQKLAATLKLGLVVSKACFEISECTRG
jgi:hypothetical protein